MSSSIRNIVIACDYAYVEGGAARVAIDTAVQLSRHTDKNVVFLAGCGEACGELKNSGVTVVSLGMYDLLTNPSKVNAFINGIYNKTAYIKCRQLFDSLGSDTILHIHTWTKVLSGAVFKAAKDAGIPIFLTVHDYFLSCPNGGCYNYVKNEICEKRPMSAACITCNCDSRAYYFKLWRCLRQARQNRVIGGCDIRYIFISDFEMRQLTRRMGQPERQYMLPNPINVHERHRVRAEDNSLYLYIGRVSEEKGTELFCQAVTKAGVRAAVIGDGALKARLMSDYPDIAFTGWLDKKDVRHWTDMARCLVFPSRWYEGSPLTVPEVQALGVPCIVTDVSAACDTVENGVTGIVTFPSADSIARAIEAAKSDSLVKALSENTFSRFDDSRRSPALYIEKLMKIYEDGIR